MRKYMPLLPVAVAYAASGLTYSSIPEDATPDFSQVLPIDAMSNGTIPPIVAALGIPTLALVIYLFMKSLASVNGPVRRIPDWWLNETTGAEAMKRFDPTYNTVLFAVTALLALTHLLILGALLHWPDWFFRGFTVLIGAGFIAVGNVIPRIRPNWIAGIRTRRILSDPLLWARAHRRLGLLLMTAGLLTILVSFTAPRWALVAAAISLLASLAISGLTTSAASAESR